MHRIALYITLIVFFSSQMCQAASFIFGNNANVIGGSSNASLSDGDFELSLSAKPNGAVFNELDNDGLGIDTSGITNATDAGSTADINKFNIIGGTSSVSGQGESITFSFDRAGILQSLLFDGLKDETLEYFTVEFPDSSVVTFFDFEVEQRLNDQSFLLADLGVPNPTQADDSSDDFIGVNYAFTAGEQFTITYGEIDYLNDLPGYDPVGTTKFGNGARFEGILASIPEPSALLMTGIGLALGLMRRSKSSIRSLPRAST